jgi:hypothetical protein
MYEDGPNIRNVSPPKLRSRYAACFKLNKDNEIHRRVRHRPPKEAQPTMGTVHTLSPRDRSQWSKMTQKIMNNRSWHTIKIHHHLFHGLQASDIWHVGFSQSKEKNQHTMFSVCQEKQRAFLNKMEYLQRMDKSWSRNFTWHLWWMKYQGSNIWICTCQI